MATLSSLLASAQSPIRTKIIASIDVGFDVIDVVAKVPVQYGDTVEVEYPSGDQCFDLLPGRVVAVTVVAVHTSPSEDLPF